MKKYPDEFIDRIAEMYLKMNTGMKFESFLELMHANDMHMTRSLLRSIK